MSDPDFWKSAKSGGREAADLKIKEMGELNELVKNINDIERGLTQIEKQINAENVSEQLSKIKFQIYHPGCATRY